MEKLMLQEVVQAVGGRLLQHPSSGADNSFSDANNAASDAGNTSASAYDVSTDTEILSVVTDSRKITPGCVFFALAGDRFDGHAYVQATLEKGAAGCVVMREPQEYLPGKFYILVSDTRRALGDRAHY